MVADGNSSFILKAVTGNACVVRSILTLSMFHIKRLARHIPPAVCAQRRVGGRASRLPGEI